MKINKMHLGAIMGAVLATSLAPSAFATTIKLVDPGTNYRSGTGGEFRAVATDAGGTTLLSSSASYYVDLVTRNIGGLGGFEVFCLEAGQSFNWGASMDAEISLGAKPGGTGGNGTIDLISVGTAYLYSSFAGGSYSLYTYSPGSGRANDAVALQNAIWYLEDEITLTLTQVSGNEFLQDVLVQYTDFSTAKGNNNSIAGVGALNLGGSPSFPKQDQLIMSDRGFSTVPDGGTTVMLMGLSLSGLAYLRRKLA